MWMLPCKSKFAVVIFNNMCALCFPCKKKKRGGGGKMAMDTGDSLATQAFLRGDPWMHSFRLRSLCRQT